MVVENIIPPPWIAFPNIPFGPPQISPLLVDFGVTEIPAGYSEYHDRWYWYFIALSPEMRRRYAAMYPEPEAQRGLYAFIWGDPGFRSPPE